MGEVKPKTKTKSKNNIMKRKLITNSLSLLTASTTLVCAVAQAADKKPNILIWGADIGYWNSGCYNRGMMG